MTYVQSAESDNIWVAQSV